MRFKGTLAEWNDDRGFGFIEPAEGGSRVFCHIKAFEDRSVRPVRGKVVTYALARDERGRPQAQKIRYSGAPARPERKPASAPHTGLAIGVSSVFLLGIIGLAVAGYLSWVVPLWYLGWSAFLFLLYGWDKNSAEGGHRRTPESSLNLLALLGGWPGGWIAQQAFRHKSRKVSFQVNFWIAVALNVAGLVWLVLAGGNPVTLLQP